MESIIPIVASTRPNHRGNPINHPERWVGVPRQGYIKPFASVVCWILRDCIVGTPCRGPGLPVEGLPVVWVVVVGLGFRAPYRACGQFTR